MSVVELEAPQNAVTLLTSREADRITFRFAVEKALDRHAPVPPAPEYAPVHRSLDSRRERCVLVSRRFCLLPDARQVGIMQVRSGEYYPLDVHAFYVQAIRTWQFGSPKELTALFDAV